MQRNVTLEIGRSLKRKSWRDRRHDMKSQLGSACFFVRHFSNRQISNYPPFLLSLASLPLRTPPERQS